MKKEDAITLLLDGKLNRIGVKSAVFVDIPSEAPMEMGWFDLIDQDHNARLVEDSLYLDMWYRAYRISNPPVNAILETKDVTTPDGIEVEMNKFRMLVELDYIVLDRERIWLL
jgi:hypothetical protein